MRKKEWYELLEKYNRLVEERTFNEYVFEKDAYREIRRKLLNYLRTAYLKAEADEYRNLKVLRAQAVFPWVIENECSKYLRWKKKADNIFASLEANQPINKADMEDSYYDTSVLVELVSKWPYIVLAVAAGVMLLYQKW